MSIERCNICERKRDTDFVSDCERCHDELWSLLEAGMYTEAEKMIEENSDIDFSDTYEQDEMFLNWRKQSEYELSQHEKGGCKNE